MAEAGQIPTLRRLVKLCLPPGRFGSSGRSWPSLALSCPLDPNRPGGKQSFTSLRSVGIWPASAMGLAGALLLDLDYTHTRDASGYSPLLDNAAVRTTRRVTTRLEYQRPLSKSLRLTVGGEWSYQDSNLELFKVRGWGPYAALQAQW